MALNEREDKIIKWQLDKYSKYRKEFLKDTEHEDILMVILRAHMYIEKEMVELTENFFENNNMLKDFKFKNRLDLLLALGVIGRELYDPIKKINDVRNDLSHKLKFEFTAERYKVLYDSLSKDILIEFKKDLELAEKLSNELNYNDKTKLFLVGVWTNLKAEVLTSFNTMRILAKNYEIQANNKLIELEKQKEE